MKADDFQMRVVARSQLMNNTREMRRTRRSEKVVVMGDIDRRGDRRSRNDTRRSGA